MSIFLNLEFPAYFNPRSRKGSDAAGYGWTQTSANFNPRSRKGSDMFLLL